MVCGGYKCFKTLHCGNNGDSVFDMGHCTDLIPFCTILDLTDSFDQNYSYRVSIFPLDMKGCIYHFTKCQKHPFISKGTKYHKSAPNTHIALQTHLVYCSASSPGVQLSWPNTSLLVCLLSITILSWEFR